MRQALNWLLAQLFQVRLCPVISGQVRAYDVFEQGQTTLRGQTLPGRWEPYCEFKPNLFMYEGSEVVAQLISGESKYKVAGMYIEFENVSDPDDVVSVPTYGRGDGVQYYDDLVSSVSRDYLRVPLIAATVTSSDTSRFPVGNVVTCFARSSGALGVHGKTFSSAANSKVFGGALIAIPDAEDATQDLVISRFYFATSKQRVKLSNAQMGVEWPITLS